MLDEQVLALGQKMGQAAVDGFDAATALQASYMIRRDTLGALTFGVFAGCFLGVIEAVRLTQKAGVGADWESMRSVFEQVAHHLEQTALLSRILSMPPGQSREDAIALFGQMTGEIPSGPSALPDAQGG